MGSWCVDTCGGAPFAPVDLRALCEGQHVGVEQPQFLSDCVEPAVGSEDEKRHEDPADRDEGPDREQDEEKH